MTAAFRTHDNTERPHQARSCRNRPPRTACPDLPSRPGLPLAVDPDRWLTCVDGQAYARTVGQDGCVSVDDVPYYSGQQYRGYRVALQVHAADRVFLVHIGGRAALTVALTGLQRRLLTFDEFVTFTCTEARSRESRSYRAAG